VERINENGEIFIRRVQDGMTDDMAAWSILIELNNRFKDKQFEVTLADANSWW